MAAQRKELLSMPGKNRQASQRGCQLVQTWTQSMCMKPLRESVLAATWHDHLHCFCSYPVHNTYTTTITMAFFFLSLKTVTHPGREDEIDPPCWINILQVWLYDLWVRWSQGNRDPVLDRWNRTLKGKIRNARDEATLIFPPGQFCVHWGTHSL